MNFDEYICITAMQIKIQNISITSPSKKNPLLLLSDIIILLKQLLFWEIY